MKKRLVRELSIIKKILITFFFILGVLFFANFLFWYLFFPETDQTRCIKDGLCTEGISIKLETGKEIIISKQTCIENEGKWVEEKKHCQF